MTTLLDLIAPFTVGQRIRWAPNARRSFTRRRTYTATAVLDQGDTWIVEGVDRKGRRMRSWWCKGDQPRIEAT